MRHSPCTRPTPAALLLILLLGAPTAGGAQEPAASPEPQAWYAERLSTGDAPLRLEYLWSRGGQFRAETVFVGHPIVTLVSGRRYIMFDRLTRRGVSIERSAAAVAQDAGRARPFANELDALLEAGGEKVRTERIAGRTCDVYRLTDDQGRREVCASPDEARLPIFAKVWMRSTGQESITRYLEWSRDIEIPDAFFEPDARVELESVSYADYVERAPHERVGPAPPLYRELLHGRRGSGPLSSPKPR